MKYVNGAWVKIRRKGCQLSLWTRSADEAFIQFVIGFVFKMTINSLINLYIILNNTLTKKIDKSLKNSWTIH
jgi:hypothetical protein